MAERDMERAEVAKATGHVGEMEQEINLLRDDQEQVRLPSLHKSPLDQKLLLQRVFYLSIYTGIHVVASKSMTQFDFEFCQHYSIYDYCIL